jgi:hypothetical protein
MSTTAAQRVAARFLKANVYPSMPSGHAARKIWFLARDHLQGVAGALDNALELHRKFKNGLTNLYGEAAYAKVGEYLDKLTRGALRPEMASTLIDEAWATGIRRVVLGAAAYTGNPGGGSIYPVQVDHGYDEPLAGGTDVMRKLQNRLLTEQGREPRPESPRLAAVKPSVPALRKPMYQMGDGLVGVQEVARTELAGDVKLVKLVSDLTRANDALHRYIDSTYIWD